MPKKWISPPPRHGDEAIQGDILLLLLREGPHNIGTFSRNLGLAWEDRFDKNFGKLRDDGLVTTVDGMAQLTEKGEHKVRVEFLKEELP